MPWDSVRETHGNPDIRKAGFFFAVLTINMFVLWWKKSSLEKKALAGWYGKKSLFVVNTMENLFTPMQTNPSLESWSCFSDPVRSTLSSQSNWAFNHPQSWGNPSLLPVVKKGKVAAVGVFPEDLGLAAGVHHPVDGWLHLASLAATPHKKAVPYLVLHHCFLHFRFNP